MDSSSDSASPLPTPPPPVLPKLVDQEITDQNKALNVLVAFVNLAQKRGSYNIDESAKIWECVKFFTEPPTTN